MKSSLILAQIAEVLEKFKISIEKFNIETQKEKVIITIEGQNKGA